MRNIILHPSRYGNSTMVVLPAGIIDAYNHVANDYIDLVRPGQIGIVLSRVGCGKTKVLTDIAKAHIEKSDTNSPIFSSHQDTQNRLNSLFSGYTNNVRMVRSGSIDISKYSSMVASDFHTALFLDDADALNAYNTNSALFMDILHRAARVNDIPIWLSMQAARNNNGIATPRGSLSPIYTASTVLSVDVDNTGETVISIVKKRN